jgi:hypothetical protein
MAEENNELQEEVVVTEVEVEELDGESNSLIWVSSLSSFSSWAVLVVFLLIVGLNVFGSIQQGMTFGLNVSTLYNVLNWLLLLSVGVSLFLVLQAIAKGILVLLDIQEFVTLGRRSE